jgi:protein TonB
MSSFDRGFVLAPLLQRLRIWSGSATMAVVGMPGTEFKGASPNARFLVGEMPAPHVLKSSWREGTGTSIVAHAVVLAVLIYGAFHVKQVAAIVKDPPVIFNVVFPNTPGPGGGGGGSVNPKPAEPPRKAEIVATKPVEVKPIPKPADVPVPDLNVSVSTPQATVTLPGALTIDANGTGGGPSGKGTGFGSGTGSGVGPGSGGNIGGGPFQAGNGITNPELLKEVKPNYTGDAMRAKLQGLVEMEAIVKPDGTVDPGSLRITRSLDQTFGLDEEAKKAVRQWRFKPGTCQRNEGCGGARRGEPVPVLVLVELSFTLR